MQQCVTVDERPIRRSGRSPRVQKDVQKGAARDGCCERPETLVSAFVARTRALRIIDWYQSSVGPPLRITSRVIVEVGRSRRLAISA